MTPHDERCLAAYKMFLDRVLHGEPLDVTTLTDDQLVDVIESKIAQVTHRRLHPAWMRGRGRRATVLRARGVGDAG